MCTLSLFFLFFFPSGHARTPTQPHTYYLPAACPVPNAQFPSPSATLTYRHSNASLSFYNFNCFFYVNRKSISKRPQTSGQGSHVSLHNHASLSSSSSEGDHPSEADVVAAQRQATKEALEALNGQLLAAKILVSTKYPHLTIYCNPLMSIFFFFFFLQLGVLRGEFGSWARFVGLFYIYAHQRCELYFSGMWGWEGMEMTRVLRRKGNWKHIQLQSFRVQRTKHQDACSMGGRWVDKKKKRDIESARRRDADFDKIANLYLGLFLFIGPPWNHETFSAYFLFLFFSAFALVPWFIPHLGCLASMWSCLLCQVCYVRSCHAIPWSY